MREHVRAPVSAATQRPARGTDRPLRLPRNASDVSVVAAATLSRPALSRLALSRSALSRSALSRAALGRPAGRHTRRRLSRCAALGVGRHGRRHRNPGGGTGAGDPYEFGVTRPHSHRPGLDTRGGDQPSSSPDAAPGSTRVTTVPASPGPRGTAAAVQVVLRVGRRVDVDHQVEVVDVDAAGGHVGRDQRGDRAGPELVEDAGALRLRLAAVQGGRASRRWPAAGVASRSARCFVPTNMMTRPSRAPICAVVGRSCPPRRRAARGASMRGDRPAWRVHRVA